MPSKLINHTLSSITAGVTQQYQEGRFESQVNNMVNCMPSITRGVLRRNPIDTSYQFYKDAGGTTPITLTNAFTYSYDRGTGTEQYIIVIINGAVATQCEMYVYNINNTNGIPLLINTSHSYLVVPSGTLAKDAFEMITVGDHTFVLNKTKTTAMNSGITAGGSTQLNSWAFYWIRKTTGIVIEQKQQGTDPVTAGNRLEGYVYTLNGNKFVSEYASAPLTARADAAPTYYTNGVKASDIATKIAAINSLTASTSFVYTTTTPSTWDWNDTFGNEASLGVWKTLSSSDQLPLDLPSALDGFIVQITGSGRVDYDDYWMQYSYDDRTWIEVPKPGVETTLDYSTMPHSIYRLADGSFVFDEYKKVAADGLSLLGTAWKTRDAGDTTSNENPSFIGKTITNLFFHRNRLGFITGDSLILSSTGDYGNFFSSTVQEVLADDPIDLAIATTDVTTIRQAVSTSGTLLLFADNAQFILSSEGSLTPETAFITEASNYTYNKNIKANAIGNKVYFSSISGGYTQLFAYKLTDKGAQVTEAIPLTLHIPSYISNTAYNLIGHDVIGYNFIQTESNKKELIVLTSTGIGQEDVQNAFHSWLFAEDIEGVNIIKNNLYILYSSGKLGRLKLEIPGTISNITYADKDTDGSNVNYDSYIEFSQFFFRDAKEKGTSRGRLQLRTLQYTITDDSRYITEIVNSSIRTILTDTDFGPTWVDTNTWDDTYTWVDVDPLYTRVYTDDDKVTVMSDTRYAEITFKNNPNTPTSGFELATVNAEMLYHQRTTRT